MSKIDELLKGEKVEWKRLGDVSEIGTGKSNTNEQDESGEYPFYVRSKDIKKIKTYEFDETAIIIPGEGGIGEVFHYVIGKYALHQRAYRIHITDQKINTRFVYHYMKQNFKKYITKFAVSATVKSIRKPMIENFEIPIPPIETQEKIVKTLDKFTKCVTELQVELQAELQARVKQYEYYRDELLSEDYLTRFTKDFYKNDIFRKLHYFKLQDLVNIIVGSDVPKNNYSKVKNEKYKIPIYSNGTDENSLYGYTDTAKVFEDSVTISARGTIGYVSLRNEPYYPIVRLLCLIPKNEELNVKFLYYFLQQYKFNYVNTGIPSLTSDMVKNIKFPLPNILIQNIIVEILDKFQFLVSETKGLLPQEIEQRQKQYEFYREKLLTFDENMIQVKSSQVLIASSYFTVIKEACDIVGTNLDKVNLKKLKDVTNIILGGTPTKRKKEYWENGNIPWMSSGEVNKKTIYNTNEFITKKGYDNSSATMVPSNSTVIALAGQGKTRGLVARVKINLCTNQSLATLVPKEK